VTQFFTRIIIINISVFSVLLGFTYIFAFDTDYADQIRTPLNFTEGCAESLCYDGVVLNETHINDALVFIQNSYDNAPMFDEDYNFNRVSQVYDLQRFSLYHPEPQSIIKGITVEGNRLRGTVHWMSLDTSLTMADLWLAFGQPTRVRVSRQFHTAQFGHFIARASTDCQAFWQQPVEIILTDQPIQGEIQAYGTLRQQACAIENGQQTTIAFSTP